MDKQTMWVDVRWCTGCGVCGEVCPTGAIRLVDGKARVDETVCTGCGTCADACPEGAIQPVIEGELVPTSRQPVPSVYRPSPLAETAGAAVAVAGVSALAKVAHVLVQAVGRWLAPRPAATRSSADRERAIGGQRGVGRGRRARRRQRGR